MDSIRRKFLENTALFSATATAFAVGLLAPGRVVAAYMADAFAASDVSGSLTAVTGSDAHTASDDIKLITQDVAENGAVVPVTVSSTLPNVESITIIATKNTSPLISTYRFQNGAEPYVSTRIKLAKTSEIIAVVKSNGQLFSASREVKVIKSDCSG